jgi:hypothetical protein
VAVFRKLTALLHQLADRVQLKVDRVYQRLRSAHKKLLPVRAMCAPILREPYIGTVRHGPK